MVQLLLKVDLPLLWMSSSENVVAFFIRDGQGNFEFTLLIC